jgi:hypothetical protein
VIRHGDTNTSSVILNNRTEFRHGSNFSHKLKLLTLSPIYLSRGAPSLDFGDYFETAYLNRIFWTYDFHRIRFKIFLHGFFSK